MDTARIALTTVLCLFSVGPVLAESARDDASSGVPAGAMMASGMASATVEAIDLETREVTLREEDGSLVTVAVSDEVRNLPQVEVGDQVVVKYKVGLITALKPSASGLRKRIDTWETARAEPGQKPAGMVRKTVQATGTIREIDPDKRMVTIQGAEQTLTLPVADGIDLANLKVGDQVDALFRETLAITVVPTPMPAAGQ